jgi:hypothetical protein
MGEFNFSDIVYVPVKCESCNKEGQAPTLKQILENKETKLSQTLEELGYIPITCGCSLKEETTEE